MSPNFIKQTTYQKSLTKPKFASFRPPQSKVIQKSPTIAKRYNWPNGKNSQTFTDSVHLKTPLKHNSFSTTHSYTTLWMTSKPHKYPGQKLVTQKETTIFIYRKIPTVSMTSQTRTGKINTTSLILINIQSYQRLR